MHNVTHTLTTNETLTATVYVNMVPELMGYDVTVGYTKRDGTHATLTGQILAVVGKGGTEAITFTTDKGFRSVNTWAIRCMG